jgi:hypothetical protein
MDSNTLSSSRSTQSTGRSVEESAGRSVEEWAGLSAGRPVGRPDRLASLTAEIDALLAEDLEGLTDAALVEEVLELRRQVDRLEGGWLQRLAGVDARGAAGAEQGVQAGSTAGWLRARLRMAAGPAATSVRTARALFGGRLPETAAA